MGFQQVTGSQPAKISDDIATNFRSGKTSLDSMKEQPLREENEDGLPVSENLR